MEDFVCHNPTISSKKAKPPAKPVVASNAPPPVPKGRKKGKLRLLPEFPLDVLYEVRASLLDALVSLMYVL